MTDQEIDYASEYDNSGRVADSDHLVSQYALDAAAYRSAAEENAELDLAYGPESRNQMDIFWPDEKRDCPIVMFIHGGYWQRLDRTSFSHMAKGLNGHGIAVAIPSYTLSPDISIDGIINEMRRAALLLYQTYGKELTVVGHSAGGHLAACLMATDWVAIHSDLPTDLVAAGMGISGLYDLAPLLKTPINTALSLTEEKAREASPIFWMPDGLQQFDAWVGGDESSEFHRQSRDLAEEWSMLGTPTKYVSHGGTNHFTVIADLTNCNSAMVQRIVDMVGKPINTDGVQRLSHKLVRAEMQSVGMEPEMEENEEALKESQSDPLPNDLETKSAGADEPTHKVTPAPPKKARAKFDAPKVPKPAPTPKVKIKAKSAKTKKPAPRAPEPAPLAMPKKKASTVKKVTKKAKPASPKPTAPAAKAKRTPKPKPATAASKKAASATKSAAKKALPKKPATTKPAVTTSKAAPSKAKNTEGQTKPSEKKASAPKKGQRTIKVIRKKPTAT